MATDMAALRGFYARYLAEHPGGGGWPSSEFADALYTFACASPLIPWKVLESVLDVGCGTARLLGTLRAKGFDGQYLGIDPLADLYGPADENLSGAARRVALSLDALEQAPASYDWLFALGTLGTDQAAKKEHDRDHLALMVKKARLGLTLQVNDRKLMSAERLEQVPGLVVHDIPDLAATLDALANPREIHVQRRHPDMPSAVITLLL